MSIIPHAEDMERALIASVLQDPLILPKVQQIVEYTDFFKEKHKEIFRSLITLEPENIDSVSISETLKEETQIYLQELVEDSDKLLPTSANVLYYAEVIKQKAKLRAGIDLGQRIIAACYAESDADEALHVLEDMFAQFLQQRIIEDKSVTTLQAFSEFVEALGSREPDDPNAIKTGYIDVDLLLQKLEGLIIIAARPSMGKTALASNIILNVARKHPVLFFSLEQSTEQIFERMLAVEAELPLEDIKLGVYDQNKLASYKNHLNKLFYNIHIDDTPGVSSSYITSIARQKRYELGSLGLIVVDYLNIMDIGNMSKLDAFGVYTKQLRDLGKELNCPVILLCQLSRAPEGIDRKKNRRPELSDLRDSGEIEQNADIVMFPFRESYYKMAGEVPEEDVVELIVRKNRNGPQGTVLLTWLPKYTKFKNEREVL